MRRATAACLTAAVLLATGRAARAGDTPPAWEPAKTWALLIGVLEWEKPGLASFPKPGRVDRVLERTLLDRGVPKDHVVFLEDREATLRRCREALDRIARASGRGSTLILYYAGHGVREDGRTFFAPFDMDPEKAVATGLSLDEIGKTLRDRWRGSRLLLLADCCHSGALGGIVGAYDGAAGVEAASLTSALASNLSTANWTFTEAAVAVLSGDGAPDADGDGAITFLEADAHVRREMRFRESQLAQARCTPSLKWGTVLAKVDPKRARTRVPGAWQIGDYAEVSWNGKWWRGQVIDAEKGRLRVHYLGYESTFDEWVEDTRLRVPTTLERQKGAPVEIEWKGRWWPGSVLEVRDDFALVHYDDYGPEWDEWVTAARLRSRGR